MSVTVYDISSAPANKLVEIHKALLHERMELDQIFSEFLDEHEDFSEDIEIQRDYDRKFAYYSNLNHLISTSEYYLKKYGIN